MSWLTRSKHWARCPRAPPRACPIGRKLRAALTASRTRLPRRNPWLCSMKLGSIQGCSTCSRACGISRSVTVGMPRSRWLPSGLGSITLGTARGRYVPTSSAGRIWGQWVRMAVATSAKLTPSGWVRSLRNWRCSIGSVPWDCCNRAASRVVRAAAHPTAG